MNKKKKISTTEFFNLKSPKNIERFINKNVDIVEQVLAYLKDKKWTQKELAKALNKKESEISKWLSGTHNLTLKTITKLEAVFEQDIIKTPLKIDVCKSKIQMHFTYENFQDSNNLSIDLNVLENLMNAYNSINSKNELKKENIKDCNIDSKLKYSYSCAA